MNSFRLLAAASILVLAGCGDGTTEPPAPTVVSVTVTPQSGSLSAIGASVQFQAVAKDASGSTVSGQTVSWSSSNTSIATISSSGLATAVSAGTAAITATVSGVAGSAVLTVSNPSQACANAKTVTLAAGGSQMYEGSDCLILPTGLSGDRYRLAVLRPGETALASDVITATLNVVGLGVSAVSEPAPSPAAAFEAAIPGLSEANARKALRVAEATERFHLWMRSQDAQIALDAGYQLLPSRRAGELTRAPALATSPAKMVFETTAGTSCEVQAGNKRTGLLIFENDDLVIYQDSIQHDSIPISQGLAQKMTSYFTSYVKDMIPEYWGELSDVDENGKVILFATPRVTGEVAAFVWSGDFYATTACAASNEKELVYFNTDLILDMEDSDPGYQALETLAHETKHIVSLYNRIAASNRLRSNQFHPTWVEEGTAEISGEISSRIAWKATGGPALNVPVSRTVFQQTGKITPENYGVAIRLARVVWYLSSQPNGLVVDPDGSADGHSVYGSGWLFHRWLGDAYGGAASAPMGDASMFRALNDSLASSGIQGIVNQSGQPFATLYQQFVTAIALHKTGAPEPAKTFTTYDLLSGSAIFSNPNPPGDFPWPVTNVGETPTVSFKTANYSGPLAISGMRIHDFLSNGTGTGAQISLNTGGKAAKMLVVRLR